MKKTGLAVALSFFITTFLLSFCSYSYATGITDMQGDGTKGNPYIITTPEEFDSIRDNLSACYKLGADIDLAGYASWVPIGSPPNGSDYSQSFSGELDGNGYTISHLAISGDVVNAGLFGYCYHAKLENIKLEDAQISITSTGNASGIYHCGGITACLDGGEIVNCGVTGSRIVSVSNLNGMAGGLAGEVIDSGTIASSFNMSFIQNTYKDYLGGEAGGIAGESDESTITDCFNTGAIFSQCFAGGIAGTSGNSTISHCYNIARVACITQEAFEEAGAITGLIVGVDGSIHGCFYLDNMQNPNFINSDTSSVSLTHAQLCQAGSYAGFNFAQDWFIDSGSGYPYAQLKSNPMPDDTENTTDFAGGTGTDYSPYLIASANQLNNVREYCGSYYKLTKDLDLSDSTSQGGAYYDGGSGWEPIGSYYSPFFGDFDGNGKTIQGMHINRANDYFGDGLFGRIKGSVENLRMTSASVSGGQYTGAIAGMFEGSAKHCSNACDVTAYMGKKGSVYLGGLFGAAGKGVIEDCYNTGNLTTAANGPYVGGVAGANSSSVSGCYNLGSVNGSGYSGGIAGQSEGNLSKCYNTGEIAGNDVGGICGDLGGKASLTITDCFNAGGVRGGYSGGIVGYLEEGSVGQCYNTANISHNTRSGSIAGDEKDGCTVANCYFLDSGEIGVGFNEASTDGNTNLLGLSLNQLISKDSFAGFDFTSTWEFNGGAYPYPTLSGVTMVAPKENTVDFASGAGTVYSPYLIETGLEFDHIRKVPGAFYSIGNDIALADLVAPNGPDYNSGAGWNPIGSDSSGQLPIPFYGVLNGNGHVVSGIFIHRGTYKFVGLFAVNTGKIYDLGLMDGSVTGGEFAGGICGDNSGTIRGCFNACDIKGDSISSSDGASVGGIAGASDNVLTDCFNTGDVTAVDDYHGLAYGTIGGIAGSAGGDLEYCYNTGTIGKSSGGYCVIGGIAGVSRSSDFKIDNCYNTGDVYAMYGYSWETGGIVGAFEGGTMDACYNTGSIVVVGNSGPAPGCGAITFADGGAIDHCYYLDTFDTGIQNVGEKLVAHVYKETASDMKSQSTYDGFDFNKIWSMDSTVNAGFPHLRVFDGMQTKVHFDTEGGSAVPNLTLSGNSTISAPIDPVRMGYFFGGWYKESGYVNVWNFSTDIVTSNITLYARWVPNQMSPSVNLSGITLSQGTLSPAFSQNRTNYTVSLGENDTGVTITPSKVYDSAAMTINGIPASSYYVPVANGKSIKVTIKVSYGTLNNTYRLTIKRPKSTDDNLASLTVSAGTLSPGLSTGVTKYSVTIPENVASVTVTATKDSSLASITNAKKTYKLRNGQTVKYTVKVRAQSGAARTYIITITRAKSTDADLSSLKSGSAKYALVPAFSAGTTSYSVTMPAGVKSFRLTAKASSKLAKVRINGRSATGCTVKGQGTVTIIVTAQAGNTVTYTITVNKS